MSDTGIQSHESLQELAEYVAGRLGDALTRTQIAFGELTLIVARPQIVSVLKLLRDDARCRFEILIDICCVDWHAREQRF